MASVHIGCSGFTYPHWSGTFYPDSLPQRRWFEYYCTIFRTVELNVTFYRLPLEKTFARWRDESPPDFSFSLKGSRFITHIKRLIDAEEPLERFFGRALALGDKLKVVLWQFPPSFGPSPERLERFLTLLDRYPARHTFEFRHEGWINDGIYALCREHNASLCRADWPAFLHDLPATADFVYIRRHGKGGNYASRYSRDDLLHDAARMKASLGEGKNVFIYFNNDAFGYAPENARELMELMQ